MMADQLLQKVPAPKVGVFPGSPTVKHVTSIAFPHCTPQQSRTRCSTEETPPIHNLSFEGGTSSPMRNGTQPKCLTMAQDDNPFIFEDYDNRGSSFVRGDLSEASSSRRSPLPGIDDAASDVSSISYDSVKRCINTSIVASPSILHVEAREPPPQEISVPTSQTARIVPDWLCSNSSVASVVSPPRGAERESPQSRPSGLMRVHSTPSPSQRATSLKRGLSVPSLGSGCNSSPPAVGIYRDASVSFASPIKPNTLDKTYVSLTCPRKPYYRRHSIAFSIGSLVGQSSYLTDITTPSSTFDSGCLVVGQPIRPLSNNQSRFHSLEYAVSFESGGDGAVLTAEKPPRTRRRNPVKQEMLYVLGKVAKPVKNLVRSSTKPKWDLKRSAGCLA